MVDNLQLKLRKLSDNAIKNQKLTLTSNTLCKGFLETFLDTETFQNKHGDKIEIEELFKNQEF